MLTKLEIFNTKILTSPLPFVAGSESTDPIQFLNIDGLGPVAADIQASSYANLDGSFFSGSSVGKRNIVLTLGFNPNWTTQTYESLRNIVYKYFMTEQKVKLQFTTTNFALCEIAGYVESCAPNIFSKDPEMVVSILCPSPFFSDVTETTLTGLTTAIDSFAAVTLNYIGSIPSGFILDIDYIVNPVLPVLPEMQGGTIQVVVNNPLPQFFQATGVDISLNTKFTMNTKTGEKTVLKRYSTKRIPTSNLATIVQNTQWPQLLPGSNLFKIMASQVDMPWIFRYRNVYGGL